MIIKKITVLMILATSLISCNPNPEDKLDNTTNREVVKEPIENELKIKKINILTDNFKSYSISAFKSYQEYIGSFGDDPDDYKSKEVSDLLGISISDIEKLKSLETTLEVPVLEELNSLINSYKINARAFSVAINSCDRYYSAKGYKKDNFENAKGMHKPVIEIYARFSATDSLLRQKSNKIIANLKIAHLNQLKNDGFEVEYLSIVGKNDAEKLNTLLTSTSYNDLKLEKLTILHGKIKKTYDRLNTIKRTEDDKFNSKSLAYFDNFEQFYQAFDELYLRKKEKKKFSRKELRALKESEVAAGGVKGSPNKVIVKYENIIDVYDKTLAIL